MSEAPKGYWRCPECGDFVENLTQRCHCGYSRQGTSSKRISQAAWSPSKPSEPSAKKPYREFEFPSDSSFICTVFNVGAAICWIAGLILGIVLGRDLQGDFSFGSALVWWVSYFMAGIVCLALSKAIEYLHVIATNSAYTARNTGNANIDE